MEIHSSWSCPKQASVYKFSCLLNVPPTNLKWPSSLISPSLISSVQFSGSLQFSLVAQSCPTLCRPMDCSTPGFPVHHQLLDLAQTHVHQVSDAMLPTHPLSSPSPSAFNLSQNQNLFQQVSSSHQVAKVVEFHLRHQSFQCMKKNTTIL